MPDEATPTQADLAQLQKNAGLPHLPTPLTYYLRLAVSGTGPRAYEWSDKPHRLLYAACGHIEAHEAPLLARIAELEAALRQIERAPAWGAPDRWETTPAEVRTLARAAIKQEEPK